MPIRRAAAALALALLLPRVEAADPGEWCGTEAGGARAILALHRYWIVAVAHDAAGPGPVLDRDESHVAILQDRGDLVVGRRPFDLDGAAVRLSPNAAGGYDLARLSTPVDPDGLPVRLAADGVLEVGLPFGFPFFGTRYETVFVHADGNLSFGSPDPGPADRGLPRFLAGPPRVAPFFADLDPSRGGIVSAQLLADRASFVWRGVSGAGQINGNTFAAVLHPGGAVDLVWGEVQTREAVVGVSPGGTLEAAPVDLSAALPVGSSGALVERFSETEKVDLVSVTRRFLAAHPDVFEQVVVYTTRPLNPVPGTLAFELNVRNDVEGIGLPLLDDSREWGSASRLASVVYMDSIDPYLEVDGFEVLAHEVGHRWLSRLRFRGSSGSSDGALLGSGGVHWSFFLDADASVMDGNDIADRGGGRFETVDVVRRYSALDQYAMGLRGPEETPPFFYVESGDDFRPNRPFKPSSGAEAGVSFTGVRRDLRIEDVVAAMGPRMPSRSSPVARLAFILVADAASPATDARIRAVARIRARFEEFYRQATDGRGAVDSTLP